MKSSKKEMKKRILALLLCMVMMLNGSVSALASEVTNETKALSEDTHVHGEECYTRTKVSEELKCGKEVVEGHTHGDTCYEVTNTPECICTLEETEGHSHDDSCFETEEIQVCTLEEHEHGGGCYTTEKELTCGQEESEEHTHDDGCYKENVECICEIDEHSHGSDCYITDTKSICGQEEKEAHFHGDACYTAVENKTLTCQLEEIESHTHGDECYEWLEELVCEIEAEELVPEEISEETVIVCETCQKEKCECEKEVENSLIQTLGETTVELSGAEEAFEAEKTYALQVNELEEEAAVMVAAAIKDVTRTANLEVLDYQAFDITLTADEEAAQPKAEVEVKFTGAKIEEYVATEDAEVKAFHVDAEGNAEEVNLTEGENEVSITTDHFSTYVVASVKIAEPVVLTTEVDGTTITLSGPVSAFAEGKTYEITAAKVEAEEEIEVIEEALEEVAEEQEKVVESYQAFDIKIMATGEDGVTEEFQPLGPVQVTFSGEMVAESVANEETETNVIHVDTATGETQDMGATATEENDVAIETTHFSIYVVVDMNQLGGEISLTVQHYAKVLEVQGTASAPAGVASGEYLSSTDTIYDMNTGVVKTSYVANKIYSDDVIELPNNIRNMDIEQFSKVCLASADKAIPNYEMRKVWVLNEESGAVSYTDVENNRAVVHKWDEYLKYDSNGTLVADSTITLNKDSVIRIWYEPVKSEVSENGFNIPATFYDYNITDGYYYDSADDANNQSNQKKYTGTGYTGNALKYVNATGQGINSNLPSSTNKKVYQVGRKSNAVYTNYEHESSPTQKVTRENIPCGLNTGNYVTPNIVKGLTADYSDVIPADDIWMNVNMFNNGPLAGKQIFSNWELDFKQDGDTYTLSAVKNSDGEVVSSNLHQIRMISDSYANNFWPLDGVTYSGKDSNFGLRRSGIASNLGGSGYSLHNISISDDGTAHNWFFGMRTDFDFTIGDYTGPLNFYFRGDDDFWLFIDGKLAVDIGGVHLSVGESLDIGEFINNPANGLNTDPDYKHRITLVYTERGGFGSSCYMQFVLPNVKPVQIPAQETTDITVKKVWNDNDNPFRPTSIKLKLSYKKTNETIWKEYETKTVTLANANPENRNEWITVWSGIPKTGYDYKVEEVSEFAGYEVCYGGVSGSSSLNLSGTNNSGIITNTLNPVTKVVVEKIWNDMENVVNSRPSNIKMQLLWKEKGSLGEWSIYPGNNGYVELDGVVDDRETVVWKYEFQNLPLKQDGKDIEYTVRELNGTDNTIISGNGTLPGISQGFDYTVTYEESKNKSPNIANYVTVTNTLVTKNLEIIKYSGSDENNLLSGAKFELKHKTIINDKLKWTAVSDNEGHIAFVNLPNGEYILTELEAPAGHSLLADDIAIVVSNEGIKINNNSLVLKNENGVSYYELKISNEPLYALPSTGGMGTDMFKISGLALMSGAALFLHKKKEDEEVQG